MLRCHAVKLGNKGLEPLMSPSHPATKLCKWVKNSSSTYYILDSHLSYLPRLWPTYTDHFHISHFGKLRSDFNFYYTNSSSLCNTLNVTEALPQPLS